jgi:hypothetical protein
MNTQKDISSCPRSFVLQLSVAYVKTNAQREGSASRSYSWFHAEGRNVVESRCGSWVQQKEASVPEVKKSDQAPPPIMDRRRFVGAAAAMVGVLGSKAFHAEVYADTTANVHDTALEPFRGTIMLDRVNVSVFEACLGQTFRARSTDGTVSDLELFAATALEPRPGLAHLGIREDPFSLMFRTSPGAALAQGNFTLEHARLGSFDLFMVPVGVSKPGDPLYLQAIFG